MIFFSFNNILKSYIIIFVGCIVFYYGDVLLFIFSIYCFICMFFLSFFLFCYYKEHSHRCHIRLFPQNKFPKEK